MEVRTVSLTATTVKPKTKRGKRKSRQKLTQKSMYILGNNSAGLLNKMESFSRNIEKFKPGVFFVQETKTRRKNQIKLNDYVIFEFIRKNKGGGGLLTAVHKTLKPVSVSEDDDVEILVVQGLVNNRKVRFINGYGPQENNSEEIREKFFNRLDFEVKSSKMAGALICIEMDANSKLGSHIIGGDPEVEQSKNGELLEKVLEDNELIVVNSTELCEGIITRYRKTIHREEKSVLDFFIVCRIFFQLIIKMEIDEKRIYSLTKFSNRRGDKMMKESDHNMMFLKININWNTSIEEKGERIEIYNYKNKENFEQFQNETENNEELKNCFEDENEDIEASSQRWLSILNGIIKKCFKKIRINSNKPNKELDELFEKKEELKIELSGKDGNTNEIDDEIEKVQNEISALCGQKNRDITNEYLGQMNDPLEGVNMAKTWNLKKRLAPKNSLDTPMAKKDATGNLVTDNNELENLYIETYMKRLQPNKITEGLETLEEMKEFLYQIRYELCQGRKSKDWEMDKFEKVLKGLKNNKARDAHGQWSYIRDIQVQWIRFEEVIVKTFKSCKEQTNPSKNFPSSKHNIFIQTKR